MEIGKIEMSELRLTLKVITPLLMNGADGKPELRAASFRGVFRYWLRALLGATYGNDIGELYKAESRYFGSTKQGSSLNLRAMGDLNIADFVPYKQREEMKLLDNVVLPARLRFEHFTAGQEFTLVLSTHPLISPNAIFTSQLYGSLLLAFTLGGFGKRSRRGGGHIQIEDISCTFPTEQIRNFKYLADVLKNKAPYEAISEVIHSINPDYFNPSIPNYPTFDNRNCLVLIGKEGYDSHIGALSTAWESAKKYAHTKTEIELKDSKKRSSPSKIVSVDRRWAWGFAGKVQLPKDLDRKWQIPKNSVYFGGRKASNVHITAHSYQNEFYPVVTIFRSSPDYDDRHSGKKRSWKLLNEFSCNLESNGFERIYGDRSSWL
jgi:CRISPR type III-B/RAMP module RAMP protein Cmr1